jgi:uncharacterized membrane protein YidH (DUF202 family)
VTGRRPEESFDVGLQHERTALAFERTAIAMMVAGVVFTRYAAGDAHPGLAVFGFLQTGAGGGLLLWAGWRYEELHAPLRAGVGVVHPTAARVIGLTTICFTAVAFGLAMVVTIAG